MQQKRKSTNTILSKQQQSELIESYLEEKYNPHSTARSNHSKKSKYTSRSKLTKSSLFKTILKKQESDLAKSKDLDVQLYLLNGSLQTVKMGQQNFLGRFEQMTGEYLNQLNQMLQG